MREESLRTFAELILCQHNEGTNFIFSRMEYFSMFPAQLQLAISEPLYILTSKASEQTEENRHDEERKSIRKL